MFYRRSYLYFNEFLVESKKSRMAMKILRDRMSHSTHCYSCSLVFEENDIRILHSRLMRDSPISHLHCFTPVAKQYIRKQDLEIVLIGTDLQEFEDWLESWNKNYFCLDYKPISCETIVQSFFPKVNKSTRSLLEVFKFLNVKDILSSVIYVNKEFYSVVCKNELWQFLICRDFGMMEICENPQGFYVSNYGRLCGDCFKVFQVNYLIRCPVLKKNVCFICFRQSKYRVLNQKKIKERFGIDMNKLDIEPATTNRHTKVGYLGMIKASVKRFRNKQKEELLKMINNVDNQHPIINDILNIDIDNMEAEESRESWNRSVFVPNYPHSDFEIFKDLFDFIRYGKGKVSESILMKKFRKE